MGGRRRLVAGAPRALGKHDGADGKAYRRAWTALLGAFGAPTPGSLVQLEMGRAAALHVTLGAAQQRLAEARRAWREGKGRRPSLAAILRLEKRAGLADQSWTAALDRLRDLVERNGHPKALSPADLLTAIGRDRPAP